MTRPTGNEGLVWDARSAAGKIMDFTAGHTYDDYLSSEMMRSAVERQFEIIGEACTVLRRQAPDFAAAIADLRDIIGVRNQLIHGYGTVDDEIVWESITAYLPPLLVQLERMLHRGHADEPPVMRPLSPG